MKRYVRTLDLKDSEGIIEGYKKAHTKENIWKEIPEGIRSVGIEEMELYILGNRLIMIIDLRDDVELDEAMTKLATLPRQQEWEEYVSQWQVCDTSSTSAEKWQPMERMFSLTESLEYKAHSQKK